MKEELNKVLSFRVTEHERQSIEDLALENGMTASAWVRKEILGLPVAEDEHSAVPKQAPPVATVPTSKQQSRGPEGPIGLLGGVIIAAIGACALLLTCRKLGIHAATRSKSGPR